MRRRFSFEEAPRNALEWAFEQYYLLRDQMDKRTEFQELAERAEKNAPNLLAGGYELRETEIDGPSEGGWQIGLPSKVVVANDAHGHGTVLWGVGTIMDQVDSISPCLGDLGLDDAPVGVSVWEGSLDWYQSGWECPEWDFTTKGAFRAPTEEEWGAIRRGLCPWDKNAWLHPECRDDARLDTPKEEE